MHAFKAGWVGQTFALATPNDSGGKKARIRRSKEERKSMVETFIKKYQKSNDGNFPSLNLTHKEVGGSFYTVREIVREIIQENRVLRPAKLPVEGQDIDNLLEHYPLGSISVEPEPSLSPLSKTQTISHITSDQNQGKELVESSEGQSLQTDHQILDREQEDKGTIKKVEDCTEYDKTRMNGAASYPLKETSDGQKPNESAQLLRDDYQKFDKDLVGKETQTTVEDEVSNETKLGSLASGNPEEISQDHVQESSEDQVLQFDAHIPGHGHIKSWSQQDFNGTSQAPDENNVDNLDMEQGEKKLLEASNSVRTIVKPDIIVEKFPLRPVAKKIDSLEGTSELQSQATGTLAVNGIEQDRVHVSKDSSSLMNSEVGADIASESVKNNSEPAVETACLNSSLESSNFSTNKETVAEMGAKVSSPVEIKAVNSPMAVKEDVNNVKASASDKQSVLKNSVGVKYKLNIEHKNSPQKGIESRFERIKFETGKVASEKVDDSSEINPLWALFKAFVDAFVKLWSE